MDVREGRLSFMLDVDNTLLDNDALKEYLTSELRVALGDDGAARFWDLYDVVRRERDVVDLPLTAQRYGVASLKIRHHAQLGYVIEAPAVAVEKLRAFPDLTHRQGMANGARFPEAGLSELDQRIREAAEQATAAAKAQAGATLHLRRSPGP